MIYTCAVCGRPILGKGFIAAADHPTHTDAELAETKQAVDLAARALAALFFLDKVREILR